MQFVALLLPIEYRRRQIGLKFVGSTFALVWPACFCVCDSDTACLHRYLCVCLICYRYTNAAIRRLYKMSNNTNARMSRDKCRVSCTLSRIYFKVLVQFTDKSILIARRRFRDILRGYIGIVLSLLT